MSPSLLCSRSRPETEHSSESLVESIVPDKQRQHCYSLACLAPSPTQLPSPTSVTQPRLLSLSIAAASTMETAMEATSDDPAFIAEGSITGIRLTVASNEEIVKAQPMKQEFPLKHPSQLSGNPALGLPLQLGRCESCGSSDLAKCEGHFGFIKLPVSIYHPSYIDELTKILNMICFSCLQFKNLQQKQKSVAKASNFSACPHCTNMNTYSLFQLGTE